MASIWLFLVHGHRSLCVEQWCSEDGEAYPNQLVVDTICAARKAISRMSRCCWFIEKFGDSWGLRVEFDFDQPCSVLRYPFKADFRLEIHGSAIDAPWLHICSSFCPAEPLPGKSLPTTVSLEYHVHRKPRNELYGNPDSFWWFWCSHTFRKYPPDDPCAVFVFAHHWIPRGYPEPRAINSVRWCNKSVSNIREAQDLLLTSID